MRNVKDVLRLHFDSGFSDRKIARSLSVSRPGVKVTLDRFKAVGKIEQLRILRLREGQFLTEVIERYRRMIGNLEEAILATYLQGVSTRKDRADHGPFVGCQDFEGCHELDFSEA